MGFFSGLAEDILSTAKGASRLAGEDLAGFSSKVTRPSFGIGATSRASFHTSSAGWNKFVDVSSYIAEGPVNVVKDVGRFAKSPAGGWTGRGLMAAGQFGGYQMAANFIDSYDNENLNVGTRGLIGATSLALRYKSFQGALGTIVGGFQSRAPGFESTMKSLWSNKTIGMGDIHNLLGMGVAKGGVGLAKFMTGAIPKSFGEYASLSKSLAFGARSEWMGKMANMSHPYAFPMAVGLAIGGHEAYYNHSSDPMLYGDYSYGPSRMPVNPQNFGMGISHGLSAISSPQVMEGQAAVANKMLTRRRV